MTPPHAKASGGKAKPVLFHARFNSKPDLRIDVEELLIWAMARLDAKEKAADVIRHQAMQNFERELDEHLRVATIDIELVEVVEA